MNKKLIKILGPVMLSIATVPMVVACGGDNKHDYVADTKLTVDYQGKNFIKDGIGRVTLRQAIDGDTAHFYDQDGSTIIKGRFNGIDTPESTGQLQPWGKGASKFTAEKLNNAKTIVLESEDPTKAAVKDSTGTRYLSFVWVSEKENCPFEEMKLLNLWIVQEGWSTAKGIAGSKYANTFTDADLQAQSLKLHVWSDESDPDFNYADPVECNLQLINEKKIMEAGATEYTDFDWDMQKVSITGIVSAVRGTDCWIEYTFNNELSGNVDKTYGMYIFTMYKSYVPLLHTGNYVKCTGTITSYMGNYQMVDVYWSLTSKKEDDIQYVDREVHDIPVVEVNAADISKNSTKGTDYLNVVVTVKDELIATGCKVTETSSGFTIGVYLTDTATHKADLYLYVEDQVHLKDRNGTRLTTKEAVMAYLSNPFFVTAPVTIFTSEEGDYTNFDLCYTGNNIVFASEIPAEDA